MVGCCGGAEKGVALVGLGAAGVGAGEKEVEGNVLCEDGWEGAG